MSAWICTRDCYDAEGRLVPGWDGTPSKPRTIVYGEFHELVQRNPGCFVRATGKGSGARMRGLDCIRARRRTADGVEFASGSALNLEAIYEDRELFDRLRLRVLEAIRLQPHDNPPTPQDSQHSGPHLAQGALFDATHTSRHIEAIADRPDNAESVKFNVAHAQHHADGTVDHISRLIDWCKTNVKGFDKEWSKLQSGMAGTKPKGDQSKAEDLNDTAARRRRLRMIRAVPAARDIQLLPGTVRIGVSLDRNVVDQILHQGKLNAGRECGGLLFSKQTTTSPIVISSASEPGPGAILTPTSFRTDPAFDLDAIEDQAQRGRVEAGSWHTHVAGSTDPHLLRRPSPKDMTAWSGARSFSGARYYVGLIVVTFERDAGQPELIPFLVSDSVSGYADVCHRATLI